MNDLQPLIDQLVKMIKDGQDLVSGQLPEVAKQILAYSAWSAGFWMKIGIVIIILGLLMYAAEVACQSSGALFFVGTIVVIVGIIFIAVSYDDKKKIELAPKAYLIEYLSHAVHKE